jgi:hypothetical protein
MKIIVIELHGLSEDNITEENAPFLYSFKTRFNSGKVKPPFGSNFFASMWTGKNPAEVDYFTKYCYDPRKNLKFFWFFSSKIRNVIYNFLKLIKGEKYFTVLDKHKYIPFFKIKKKFHYFQTKFSRDSTFFDKLKKQNRSYLFYEHPVISRNRSVNYSFGKGDNISAINRFLKLMKNKPRHDFHFLMLRETDILGHKYGPYSKEVQSCLRVTDRKLKRLLEHFSFKDNAIFIMTGYGMLKVQKSLDLESKLPLFGDGYVYFLDSTMARFWFFNEEKKKEVMRILSTIVEGRILSKDEQIQYGINFSDNQFFEEIFLVNQSVVISPCFFHTTAPKGMHTYDLSNKKELGYIYSNVQLNKITDTVDLSEFFLNTLNERL